MAEPLEITVREKPIKVTMWVYPHQDKLAGQGCNGCVLDEGPEECALDSKEYIGNNSCARDSITYRSYPEVAGD